MADIRKFVQLATTNLRISEKTAQDATGSLLGFLGEKMGERDFQALLGQLPGAAALVPTGAAKTGAGAGLLGGLTKLAGGALGGKLGGAAGILGALKGAGLDSSQVGDFLTQFLGFAKQNLSGDVLDKLLTQVPDLRNAVK